MENKDYGCMCLSKKCQTQRECRLIIAIEHAAKELFDGSKALQHFIPGSEAQRMQEGMDRANVHLYAILEAC